MVGWILETGGTLAIAIHSNSASKKKRTRAACENIKRLRLDDVENVRGAERIYIYIYVYSTIDFYI